MSDEEESMSDIMLEAERELTELTKLLPAWFTLRMMGDTWSFGLLLVTGQVLCIHTITKITQGADGSLWLDVDMMLDNTWLRGEGAMARMITSPTARTTASVNAAHVIAAFELDEG